MRVFKKIKCFLLKKVLFSIVVVVSIWRQNVASVSGYPSTHGGANGVGGVSSLYSGRGVLGLVILLSVIPKDASGTTVRNGRELFSLGSPPTPTLGSVGPTSSFTGESDSGSGGRIISSELIKNEQKKTRTRVARQLSVIAPALQTMGCLPKFFCGMNSKAPSESTSTLNDLAYLIRFAMVDDDDSSNEGNKAKEGLNSNEYSSEKTSSEERRQEQMFESMAEEQLVLDDPEYLSYMWKDMKVKLKNKFKDGKIDDDVFEQMMTDLDKENKGSFGLGIPNIFSGLKNLVRFGRSVPEYVYHKRRARAFWETEEFDEQMKLAARIGKTSTDDQCTSTFNLCPYTMAQMKGMISPKGPTTPSWYINANGPTTPDSEEEPPPTPRPRTTPRPQRTTTRQPNPLSHAIYAVNPDSSYGRKPKPTPTIKKPIIILRPDPKKTQKKPYLGTRPQNEDDETSYDAPQPSSLELINQNQVTLIKRPQPPKPTESSEQTDDEYNTSSEEEGKDAEFKSKKKKKPVKNIPTAKYKIPKVPIGLPRPKYTIIKTKAVKKKQPSSKKKKNQGKKENIEDDEDEDQIQSSEEKDKQSEENDDESEEKPEKKNPKQQKDNEESEESTETDNSQKSPKDKPQSDKTEKEKSSEETQSSEEQDDRSPKPSPSSETTKESNDESQEYEYSQEGQNPKPSLRPINYSYFKGKPTPRPYQSQNNHQQNDHQQNRPPPPPPPNHHQQNNPQPNRPRPPNNHQQNRPPPPNNHQQNRPPPPNNHQQNRPPPPNNHQQNRPLPPNDHHQQNRPPPPPPPPGFNQNDQQQNRPGFNQNERPQQKPSGGFLSSWLGIGNKKPNQTPPPPQNSHNVQPPRRPPHPGQNNQQGRPNHNHGRPNGPPREEPNDDEEDESEEQAPPKKRPPPPPPKPPAPPSGHRPLPLSQTYEQHRPDKPPNHLQLLGQKPTGRPQFHDSNRPQVFDPESQSGPPPLNNKPPHPPQNRPPPPPNRPNRPPPHHNSNQSPSERFENPNIPPPATAGSKKRHKQRKEPHNTKEDDKSEETDTSQEDNKSKSEESKESTEEESSPTPFNRVKVQDIFSKDSISSLGSDPPEHNENENIPPPPPPIANWRPTQEVTTALPTTQGTTTRPAPIFPGKRVTSKRPQANNHRPDISDTSNYESSKNSEENKEDDSVEELNTSEQNDQSEEDEPENRPPPPQKKVEDDEAESPEPPRQVYVETIPELGEVIEPSKADNGPIVFKAPPLAPVSSFANSKDEIMFPVTPKGETKPMEKMPPGKGQGNSPPRNPDESMINSNPGPGSVPGGPGSLPGAMNPGVRNPAGNGNRNPGSGGNRNSGSGGNRNPGMGQGNPSENSSEEKNSSEEEIGGSSEEEPEPDKRSSEEDDEEEDDNGKRGRTTLIIKKPQKFQNSTNKTPPNSSKSPQILTLGQKESKLDQKSKNTAPPLPPIYSWNNNRPLIQHAKSQIKKPKKPLRPISNTNPSGYSKPLNPMLIKYIRETYGNAVRLPDRKTTTTTTVAPKTTPPPKNSRNNLRRRPAKPWKYLYNSEEDEISQLGRKSSEEIEFDEFEHESDEIEDRNNQLKRRQGLESDLKVIGSSTTSTTPKTETTMPPIYGRYNFRG